jgi:hypothetical protein
MDPADLEGLLDRELKQLPAPRAPQTLLPRVMAATAGRDVQVPEATGWLTWPLPWRVASVAAVALAAYAAWWLLSAPPGANGR